MAQPGDGDYVPPQPPTVGSPRDRGREGQVEPPDDKIKAEVKAVSNRAQKVSRKLACRLERDGHGNPKQLKWRPVISMQAMFVGAFADVAVELLLQQLGLILLNSRDLLEGIIQGSLLGAAAPMLGNLVGVIWVNQKINKLRAQVTA